MSFTLALCSFSALGACDGEPTATDGSAGTPDAAASDGDSGGPRPVPVTTIAELGLTPFDVDRQDQVGPEDHSAMYGRAPEIIVVSDGSSLDILVQDHTDEVTPRAYLLRLSPDLDDYAVEDVLEVPIIDRIMGLARDDAGAHYIASGIVESRHRELTVDYPADGEYRNDIVRVMKLDSAGESVFTVDLDTARQGAGDLPEQLINPMVASSARLAVGGGRLALVHGINTSPDSEGTRHQKAITTHLDASDGEVLRLSSIWVSHSFDQRVFYDGAGFMEMHLGDAYPRVIATARVSEESTGSYALFHIKGRLGANNTRTRLGNLALIERDPMFGYLALFSTERSAGTEPLAGGHSRVAGMRDLGIVRLRRDFETTEDGTGAHLDPSMPDTQDVISGDTPQSNRLRWLTNHESEAVATHAERPKLVPIGGDRYIVLYERWSLAGTDYAFDGTFGLLIDATGSVLAGATRLSASHLPRGDDAVRVGDQAGWVTGDREAHSLTVHLVDDSLTHRAVIVE